MIFFFYHFTIIMIDQPLSAPVNPKSAVWCVVLDISDEKSLAMSFIMALNLCSYVIQRDKLRDRSYHLRETTDSLRSSPEIVSWISQVPHHYTAEATGSGYLQPTTMQQKNLKCPKWQQIIACKFPRKWNTGPYPNTSFSNDTSSTLSRIVSRLEPIQNGWE